MAFHPIMSQYPFKVIATDPKQPGWSSVYAGYKTREAAEGAAQEYRDGKLSGTAHLTFIVVEEK